MEFALCNKSKIAVKLTKQQNFAVPEALFGKLWNNGSNTSFLNSENCSIPHRLSWLGQTTKHSLSNFDPQKPWKYKQCWGLRSGPVAYKQSLVSYHFSFFVIHNFFKRQNSYKQRHAEIGKKIEQMLSNTLILNFCFYSHSLPTLSSKSSKTHS